METPFRGNARDPNAPPPCRCGCTPPPGAGTWTPIPPGEPGHRGPGTGPRQRPASSTPSPHSAACCGPNELQPCTAPNPTTRKSPKRYSTRSPTPHSRIEECESPPVLVVEFTSMSPLTDVSAESGSLVEARSEPP